MLAVQNYLLGGKTLADLTEEFGIKVYEHPTLPLIGAKYDQIDSPKAHPIVRECRGIVMEKGTWQLIAKGFNRFFNVGEQKEEYNKFDWDNCVAQEKLDGSLILCYYYANQWHVNTSGSFGFGEAQDYPGTWRDLFYKALGADESAFENIDKNYTLVFELCSPYNKIVRHYKKAQLYLLSVFKISKESSHELDSDVADELAQKLSVLRPEMFRFNFDQAKKFLLQKEETDKTYEGLVLKDINGLRFKFKTQTYLALHHIKGNGNILLPKYLVPIVLAGSTSEICAVWPEFREEIEKAEMTLSTTYQDLLSLWEKTKDIKSQKDYANEVKSHPLSCMLFTMRKCYVNGDYKDLKSLWRDSGEILVKKLFSKEI